MVWVANNVFVGLEIQRSIIIQRPPMKQDWYMSYYLAG